MKRFKYLALAALVAFAACDEGDEVPTAPPPVTGSITGTVTIDGQAASGVSVALSGSGTASASTDASGRYTFSDVLAGAYTVTISGTPADASFGSMSSGVVIGSAGQVATADFSGSYIKTSSVAVSVGVTNVGALAGVTATLSGSNLGGSTMTMTTDANGSAVFAGLRAGTYSVAVSGYDAGQYSFATTSASVTVAQGASEAAAFTGTRNATGQVTGIVTLDGTAAAGLTVTLSNGETKTTAANGRYAFGNLLPGEYTVTLSNLPNDAVFTGGLNQVATVAASGDVVTVDFAGALVGTASIAGVVSTAGSPLAGVTVTVAGPTAGTYTTGADGSYQASDLLAGSYTVSISGYDAAQNMFAATSMPVVLNPGQAAPASFSGTVPTTSMITGVAMIDGAAAAGLTVTMGAATQTTDAAGRYTFANLAPGNYTLVISGAAADVAWTAASQSTDISAAAETDVVDFSGAVRLESTISGVVTGGSAGLAGVTVAVSGGPTTVANQTTDANGVYNFDKLRMGTYTVTISGFDATTYNFTTTTASVTVGLAQSQAQNFNGPIFATASISGRMFIDADGDNADGGNTTLEPTITDQNVTVTIVGGDVATTQTTTTANGLFAFNNLPPGNYNVTINAAGVANTYALGQASATTQAFAVGVGEARAVNYPFDIARQTIVVGAMLGRDENASAAGATVPSRVAGYAGQNIRLYDTYANAVTNNGVTGLLGAATTGAAGTANITFLRTADTSPQGGTDRVVFAVRNVAPAAPYVADGEAILEINYTNTSATFTAPDVFDVLNTRAEMTASAQTIAAAALNGWTVNVTRGATFATSVNVAQPVTGVPGTVSVVENLVGGVAALPVTYYARLDQNIVGGVPAGPQPTNGHAFTDAGVAGDGTATADYVQFTFDGTRVVATPFNLGTLAVTYSDVTLTVNVHNEQDDVAGRTAGDGFTNANKIDIALRNATTNAIVRQTTPLPSATGRLSTVSGGMIFTTVPTGVAYNLTAAPSALFPGELAIMTAASVPVAAFSGADTTATVAAVAGGATSAFAYKHINNTIGGTSLAASDGVTPAAGLTVTLTPTAGHLYAPAVKTTTTNAGGAYNFTAVQEGPYTITITDGNNWAHQATVLGNDGPNSETRDVQGAALAQAAVLFTPRYMNTTINGQVANDADLNNLIEVSNGELVAGVTMQVFNDANGNGAINAPGDAVVGTTTTNNVGGYTFTGLPEGAYIVSAPGSAQTDAQLRSFSVLNSLGTGSNLAPVVTGASVALRTQGSATNTGALPSWNYGPATITNANTTNFVPLYNDGTISGSVVGATSASGALVTLRRCSNSASTPSPAQAVGDAGIVACTQIAGSAVSTFAAGGTYSFTGLQEGVYQITVDPASGGPGLTGATVPPLVPGPAVASISIIAFVSGPTDTEAAPAFTLN